MTEASPAGHTLPVAAKLQWRLIRAVRTTQHSTCPEFFLLLHLGAPTRPDANLSDGTETTWQTNLAFRCRNLRDEHHKRSDEMQKLGVAGTHDWRGGPQPRYFTLLVGEPLVSVGAEGVYLSLAREKTACSRK